MSRWDRDIPETVDDVVALLERRIEVHRAWAEALRRGDPRCLRASEHGAGTAESHERYAGQYEAAIGVLRCSSIDTAPR